eukprot:m.6920 g.6920  ORF g.6920 m.6920 type:complete len:97 (-) comp6364_c0_seq1:394-684(-)
MWGGQASVMCTQKRHLSCSPWEQGDDGGEGVAKRGNRTCSRNLNKSGNRSMISRKNNNTQLFKEGGGGGGDDAGGGVSQTQVFAIGGATLRGSVLV